MGADNEKKYENKQEKIRQLEQSERVLVFQCAVSFFLLFAYIYILAMLIAAYDRGYFAFGFFFDKPLSVSVHFAVILKQLGNIHWVCVKSVKGCTAPDIFKGIMSAMLIGVLYTTLNNVLGGE